MPGAAAGSDTGSVRACTTGERVVTEFFNIE